jgi:SAM-dependent methyltransferase
MLALAGDAAGRRILDAGCGAGPLFAALRDRGAIVTGIDKSAGMVGLRRIPPRAAPRRNRGQAALLVLPVLRPARQLIASEQLATVPDG